jgi:aspartate aminotransferase-like enzyme
MISGGVHVEIASKYFRMGHMHISSLNTSLGHIDTTLGAIQAALLELGFDVLKQKKAPHWVPRNKSRGHDEL